MSNRLPNSTANTGALTTPASKACGSSPCFFSRFGPGQRPDLVLETFRRKIEAGQSVFINGDGSQHRYLTYVTDMAQAVRLALRWQEPVRQS